MYNTTVRYLMIIPLMLTFINRGLFVSGACEMENQNNGEINSIVELLAHLVTGECNDIDEDGDTQSDCHFVKIVQQDFSQQFSHSLDFSNLQSKTQKKLSPRNENIPLKNFYGQIDHPPKG